MFVVVSYDISSRGAGDRGRRICEKYLRRIQKSVYEGNISENKLRRLKDSVAAAIDAASDSVIIYRFSSPVFPERERLGVVQINDDEFI